MPTSPTKSRRLATIQESAAVYGVNPKTIRRRIADGTITGYRLAGSRAIRVDLNELERALLQPIVGRPIRPAVGK